MHFSDIQFSDSDDTSLAKGDCVASRFTSVILISGIALLACAACGDKNGKGASANSAAPALANGQPANAAKPEASSAVGFSNREGNTFYYSASDGTAVGVQDLGWSLEGENFVRVLTAGNEFMKLQAGSTIVHTGAGSVTPGGVVRVVGEETYPLAGAAVASVAMRDALAGHLSAPGNPPDKTEYKNGLRAKRSACAEEGMKARRERLAQDGPVPDFTPEKLEEFATYDCGPPIN